MIVKTMKENATISIGSLALIEKVDDNFQFFPRIFGKIGGRAKNLVSSTKLFIYNRLTECFATNRLRNGYSAELFSLLKFEKLPSDRTFYRDLERIGKNYFFILCRYQEFIHEEQLVADTQFFDFSSSYFEGKADAFGALGYSRDGQPGKKQLTFGIATGVNGIPTALTIQKGNVQDKAHFRFMLKASEAVLDEDSLIIFDTGGNTKENKRLVREKSFHYLTLKPKKIGPYRKAIEYFKANMKAEVAINGVSYLCVKRKVNEEVEYIFFCEKLKEVQLELKQHRFKRELEKNKWVLKKTKEGKEIDAFLTEEGIVTTKGSFKLRLMRLKIRALMALKVSSFWKAALILSQSACSRSTRIRIRRKAVSKHQRGNRATPYAPLEQRCNYWIYSGDFPHKFPCQFDTS